MCKTRLDDVRRSLLMAMIYEEWTRSEGSEANGRGLSWGGSMRELQLTASDKTVGYRNSSRANG